MLSLIITFLMNYLHKRKTVLSEKTCKIKQASVMVGANNLCFPRKHASAKNVQIMKMIKPPLEQRKQAAWAKFYL